MEGALRLDPNMGVRRMTQLAIAYYLSGRYKDAVSAAQKAVKRSPKFFLGYAPLAAAYAQLGRTDDAIDAARKLRGLRPFFTIDWFTSAIRDPDDAAHMANGLQKAGLKKSRPRE